MSEQSDRELDWSVERELERKDAEIARLRADLSTYVTATTVRENKIIDVEFERERCAKIAERIATEHSNGDGELYIARKIADEIRRPALTSAKSSGAAE